VSRLRALLLGGALALAGCPRFDAPIEKDLAAEDRWAEVEALRERRLTLAAGLVQAARSSAARDAPAVTAAAEARARANLRLTGDDAADRMKVAAILRADAALSAALGRLLALRTQAPGLWEDGEHRDAEGRLAGDDQAILRAMDAYDAAARAYDEEIARLPRNAVNRVTGRRFLPRVILADVTPSP
jgi:LemA protein